MYVTALDSSTNTVAFQDGDGDLYRKEKEHEQRQQFRDVMNQLASIVYRYAHLSHLYMC